MKKILIVDEFILSAEALGAVISTNKGVEVDFSIMPAKDYSDKCCSTDLVVLHLPFSDTRKFIENALQANPKMHILLIARCRKLISGQKCLAGSIDGVVTLDCRASTLKQAVDTILAGRKFFPPDIISSLLTEFRTSSSALSLTARETEVLRLICQGMPSKEIADKIHLGETTVKTYRQSLLEKFEACNSAQLIFKAVKQGMV